MKISKTRLLQIIREEVELREKNTYELDEEELSDKQEKQAIDDEIRADKEAGNLEEEDTTAEDQIINPKDKEVVVPKHNKLEIRIR